MTKRKSDVKPDVPRPAPGKQYPGVRGKIVDWAEHVFEEGMLYVRVRFTDKTELCWVLQTAHVIVEADLGESRSMPLGLTRYSGGLAASRAPNLTTTFSRGARTGKLTPQGQPRDGALPGATLSSGPGSIAGSTICALLALPSWLSLRRAI
jgi:hypothetical protein